MNKEDNFEFRTGVIGFPILFVLLIWFVFWFEIRFGFDFNAFGIYPRTLKGFVGIFFSPFIHADLTHLWHNTLPLLILSSSLFYFYANNAWKVLILGTFITGFLTWVLGRPANHIGISGVIYLLFGFLFFKGILTKHFRLIALSLIVVFVYGSMVWYILPIDPKISWEGHLSGLIVGTVFALIIKKGIKKRPTYVWESPDYDEANDEFLKHFDEDGNFIEKLPELTEEDDSTAPTIIYTYKEENKGQMDQSKSDSKD